MKILIVRQVGKMPYAIPSDPAGPGPHPRPPFPEATLEEVELTGKVEILSENIEGDDTDWEGRILDLGTLQARAGDEDEEE